MPLAFGCKESGMSSGSICIPPVAPCNQEPSLKSDLYTYIITYIFKPDPLLGSKQCL